MNQLMITCYQCVSKMASPRSRNLAPSHLVKVAQRKISSSQPASKDDEKTPAAFSKSCSQVPSSNLHTCASRGNYGFHQRRASYMNSQHGFHKNNYSYQAYDRSAGSSRYYSRHNQSSYNFRSDPKFKTNQSQEFHNNSKQHLNYKRKHAISPPSSQIENHHFSKKYSSFSSHQNINRESPSTKKQVVPSEKSMSCKKLLHQLPVSKSYSAGRLPDSQNVQGNAKFTINNSSSSKLTALSSNCQEFVTDSNMNSEIFHGSVAAFHSKTTALGQRQHADNSPSSSVETTVTDCVINDKLKRSWQTLEPVVKTNEHMPSCDQGSFTIASYNILSQALLQKNSYLYDNCEPKVLPWNYRWNNLCRELELLNVDVLCLQEVEDKHYERDIAPWLTSKGYKMFYKKRTGNDWNKPDGVLTACKSSKFVIINAFPIEYYRDKHNLTSGHNVGLAMLLKMSSTDSTESPCICIGNTHLLYNPKRGDIKMVQLATLFAEVNSILRHHQQTSGHRPPLVLCGDFNSTPDSPLFRFITRGSLFYEGMEMKEVSGQKSKGGMHRTLSSEFLPASLRINNSCVYDNGQKPETNKRFELSHQLGPLSSSSDHRIWDEATTTQKHGITVDYVFFSSTLRDTASSDRHPNVSSTPSTKSERRSNDLSRSIAASLKLTGRLTPCTARDIRKVNSIPNSQHSSDHLPVVAQFQVCV